METLFIFILGSQIDVAVLAESWAVPPRTCPYFGAGIIGDSSIL